jgi:hypothetical protein
MTRTRRVAQHNKYMGTSSLFAAKCSSSPQRRGLEDARPSRSFSTLLQCTGSHRRRAWVQAGWDPTTTLRLYLALAVLPCLAGPGAG